MTVPIGCQSLTNQHTAISIQSASNRHCTHTVTHSTRKSDVRQGGGAVGLVHMLPPPTHGAPYYLPSVSTKFALTNLLSLLRLQSMVLNIRDFPEELVSEAKVIALNRGVTLRALVIEALRAIVAPDVGKRESLGPSTQQTTSKQETERIIREAQEKLETRKRQEVIQGPVKAFGSPLPADFIFGSDERAVRDFKKQYNREPSSEFELELFKKRGW